MNTEPDERYLNLRNVKKYLGEPIQKYLVPTDEDEGFTVEKYRAVKSPKPLDAMSVIIGRMTGRLK